MFVQLKYLYYLCRIINLKLKNTRMKNYLLKLQSDFGDLTMASGIIFIGLIPSLLAILSGYSDLAFNDSNQNMPVWGIIFTSILFLGVLIYSIVTPLYFITIPIIVFFGIINLLISIYSVFFTVDFSSEFFSGIYYVLGEHTVTVFKYVGIFGLIPIFLGLFGLITILIMPYDEKESERINKIKKDIRFDEKNKSRYNCASSFYSQCYYCHNFERYVDYVHIPFTNIKLYQKDIEKCMLGNFECSHTSCCLKFNKIKGLKAGDRVSIKL